MRPTWQARCGSLLPGAAVARGDQWERPVADLGVYHMAWPADMQCYRGSIVRHPRQPVSLKIGREIQNLKSHLILPPRYSPNTPL